MLPIANLKPSSSCNYGARREPLHNKPRSAKRSAKRSATITLTTDNQRLMEDKRIGLSLLLICELILGGFIFSIGGWMTVLIGALATVAIVSGIFGIIILLES